MESYFGYGVVLGVIPVIICFGYGMVFVTSGVMKYSLDWKGWSKAYATGSLSREEIVLFLIPS